MDWENAVEGVDKVLSTILEASKNWNIGSRPRRVRGRERKTPSDKAYEIIEHPQISCA